MKRSVAALVCTVALLASTGCGYHVARHNDIAARGFAADSATIISLQNQIASLRAQCQADSARMAAEKAVIPAPVVAAPPLVTTPDSLLKARDTEIATLRDQLTRANAELERIKRRLANPRS